PFAPLNTWDDQSQKQTGEQHQRTGIEPVTFDLFTEHLIFLLELTEFCPQISYLLPHFLILIIQLYSISSHLFDVRQISCQLLIIFFLGHGTLYHHIIFMPDEICLCNGILRPIARPREMTAQFFQQLTSRRFSHQMSCQHPPFSPSCCPNSG